MADSAEVARRNRQQIAKERNVARADEPRNYNTRYVKLDSSEYSTTDAPRSRPKPIMDDQPNRPIILFNRPNKTTPAKPSFLGSQRTIIFAWIIAVIAITADEWKRYHILPRPSRLWWSALVYGILALVSEVTPVIPLTNALALGYSIMLMWQFFNKSGQFSEQ
jgi:hypothetical protein